MNRLEWGFAVALVFIFLIVVDIIGLLCTNEAFVSSFHLTSSQLESFLSIVISCISILLTGFFAVLAIDAYGKIRDIKRQANEAKNYRDMAYKSLRDFGNTQISFYQNVIKNIDHVSRLNKDDDKIQKHNTKWRTDTYRDLYRLGLDPLLMDEDRRIEYIRNLSVFAEREDWDKIEDISESSTESDKVKRIAKMVLNNRNGQNTADYNMNSNFSEKSNSFWGLFKKCRWWGGC